MSDEKTPNALETYKAQPIVAERRGQVAENLRKTARRLAMQSGSRRGIYQTLGLRPRFRDTVFKALFILSFVFLFAAPIIAGLTYLGLYVSPQYEVETRFVLRSALPALNKADTPKDANVASFKVVQDTLVVISFLDSPVLVQRLDEDLNLESIYARDGIDWLSRLERGQGNEEKTEYINDFISADVSSVSGIVTLKVRAFSPEEALKLLNATFALAEERVNLLNGEIWASVLDVAQRNFETASEQLRNSRQRFAALQNETGVFDVKLEAEALSAVITKLRTELIDLENRRNTLLLDAPKNQVNIARFDKVIKVRRAQLEKLESEVAGVQAGDDTLSGNQQRFDALKIEVEIAQERFKSAAIELEQAKLLNSVQMLYLDRFVQPTLPQESTYPVYAWEIARLVFLSFAAWGLAVLALAAIQRKMD